ncbi:endolytic transglycosylase MltG [Nocardia panacis]|uniref:Endolytic murein transglycosylase n=1 Tax=Nocardia panacis TaxID=2340916 RepID=A0A3A4JWM1_9NOCA|nr:endolytic transglycosylase MltG [Nocardia panacis]RJO68362.1 endolytic transglycosylase MltG [Nocardia panacis]
MTDRWARAEERFRQREAERRYRRDDDAWERDDQAWEGEPPANQAWEPDERDNQASHGGRHAEHRGGYDDDTTVIPRYTDDQDYPPPPGYARESRYAQADHVEDEYEPAEPERPAPRRVGRRESARGDGKRTQPRAKRSRIASRKAAERKRRRRNLWIIGGVFVVLFAGAAAFAAFKLMKRFNSPDDFAGPTGPLVVVQVQPGDTAAQIAESMVAKGVVASSGAFYEAALRNSNMSALQPGYYAIPSHSQGAKAVTALVDKESRVGNVIVSEGRQLHDQQDVKTGARSDGILRKIADASCFGAAADRKCVTYEQLDAAGASTDLASLGVPNWATQSVQEVPTRSRQLEGLIAAGTWDFDPSGTPVQILKQIIAASTRSYENSGLLQAGARTGLTPYQMLIGASLVEREALPRDMARVARVIVNRLKVDQKLEFDSTVNYTLDRIEIATDPNDRFKKTAWNTYMMLGLPATPISSPSPNALKAMENPEVGTWLYFVTIDFQGTTLFTESYEEHRINTKVAEKNGVLNSDR